MTLREAIEHAEEVARTADCEECRAEHQQLARWLKELEHRRNRIKYGLTVDEYEKFPWWKRLLIIVRDY